MNKNIALACLASATLLLGCGGGDDTTGTTPDMAMQIFKVQSGSYTVSNLVQVSDVCQLGLTSATFTKLMVTNDGMGHLKLGSLVGPADVDPSYTPAAYTNGEGMFADSYHATTTMTTMVTADVAAGCKYNLTRTNNVTVTADNKLHIEFKEDESAITAGCGVNFTTCSSQYTYDAGM